MSETPDDPPPKDEPPDEGPPHGEPSEPAFDPPSRDPWTPVRRPDPVRRGPHAETLRLAAGGDQAAWNALVESYTPHLMSAIRSYRLSESDAEDVAQITWLRLIEHLHQLAFKPEVLPAWIGSTARFEALRVIRQSTRATLQSAFTESVEELASVDSPVEEELVQAESVQLVRNAVRELPPRSRQLMELLLADYPLTYSEISSELNMPIGSIGPTRARAMARLRMRLADRGLELAVVRDQ